MGNKEDSQWALLNGIKTDQAVIKSEMKHRASSEEFRIFKAQVIVYGLCLVMASSFISFAVGIGVMIWLKK